MKFCVQINKKNVLKTAMTLISSANKNIDITMDVAEELRNSLPDEYHKRLTNLLKKGIKISRYVFGPKNLFKIIKNKYPMINTYYSGEINKYQRMLIIDKEKGLFAVNEKVFFTEFKPLIKSLLEYVRIY